MIRFVVTFEIVTEESAAAGDVDERGYIENGARLRDAIDAVQSTRTSLVDGGIGTEPSESPGRNFRFITVYNGMEYETGAHESRALHIPDNVTPSSRARIARLLGVNISFEV